MLDNTHVTYWCIWRLDWCLLWLFLREIVLYFPILSKFHPRMYPLSARNPNVASELAQWNLHFEDDLQKIEGRQLPQENIVMLDNRGRGDCAVSVTVFSASWQHPSSSILATPQSVTAFSASWQHPSSSILATPQCVTAFSASWQHPSSSIQATPQCVTAFSASWPHLNVLLSLVPPGNTPVPVSWPHPNVLLPLVPPGNTPVPVGPPVSATAFSASWPHIHNVRNVKALVYIRILYQFFFLAQSKWAIVWWNHTQHKQ